MAELAKTRSIPTHEIIYFEIHSKPYKFRQIEMPFLIISTTLQFLKIFLQFEAFIHVRI